MKMTEQRFCEIVLFILQRLGELGMPSEKGKGVQDV
jgi:hypothetical protein